MSDLLQKQQQFTAMVAKLIIWAYEHGYCLTFGDAYRSPEQAAANAKAGTGIARSLHCDRLAVDLNLFRNGEFLGSSESHRPLGEFWESIGGTWGGRFKDKQGNPKPDGNHYSLAFEGRK